MRQKTSLPLAPLSSLNARPDLTAALVDKEQEIRALKGEVAAQALIIESLRAQLEKRETDQHALENKLAEQLAREQTLRAAIDDMIASLSWKFAQRLRSWRLTAAPLGTVRDRILSR